MSTPRLAPPWGPPGAPSPGWFAPHWDLGPPQTALIGDHAVDLRGDSLVGKRVALLVTGGIAAFRAPALVRALRREGAAVTPMVSAEGARFVSLEALAWAADGPVVTALGPRAEHLSESAAIDAYLVAPATYDTINKLAAGIADGPLTATLASALGRLERGGCAVLVAPTMHGTMHNRVLVRSLRTLVELGVEVIPPRDALGKDNLPPDEQLVAAVARALAPASTRGERALLLGGRWPWEGRLPAAAGGDWRAEAWRLHLRGVALGLWVPDRADRLPDGLPLRRSPGLEQAAAGALQALHTGEIDALHVNLTTCAEDPGLAMLRAAGALRVDEGPEGARAQGALRPDGAGARV